ncbi:MAG TPA: hypothetical protein VFV34_06865 [Blastocatellia bacterium]|nr:hypothetical protein [Blastocatellia bacterium]
MKKRFAILGIVTGTTVCAMFLVWNLASRVEAQDAQENQLVEGNFVFVGRSGLPMPGKEILARFAMRMPPSALGGQPVPITVPVRLNIVFDVSVDDQITSRTPVVIPVDLVLRLGELGTLDVGWDGNALTITRDGNETITREVPLAGDEVYISMAVDSPRITFRRNGRSQSVLPLGSTTIFHESGTPETIISPRDSASGLPTG